MKARTLRKTMANPIRRTRPPSEPVVGEAFERALETMMNLARRIEKIKTDHESFKKMEGGNYMTPRESNERLMAIRTSIRWLIAQCKGFAYNRGNEEPLVESMTEISRNAASIRKSGRPVAARDFWITETTSELERWLEENRLLINFTEPERDFTEIAWRSMIREAAHEYRREHAEEEKPKDTDGFDDGLEEFEEEEGGDEDGSTERNE
jgi:hypothetical protein